jgi:hypothetical protein
VATVANRMEKKICDILAIILDAFEIK